MLQLSCSVVSDSLRPHGLQHTRPPVHHQLPQFTQTHARWVGDAIQPSHPLLSPSPPALNPSQHQGLSKWVSCLHQVAKVLEFQLQHQSFQWIFRMDWLDLLAVQGTQESSPTPQFKSINSSIKALEWKLTFSSPVATAEFSKFAGIWSAYWVTYS